VNIIVTINTEFAIHRFKLELFISALTMTVIASHFAVGSGQLKTGLPMIKSGVRLLCVPILCGVTNRATLAE
jgi:hypothetical protein